MPPFDCVAQVCESVEETPGDPISRRGHATERLASISLSLPSEENLVAALKPHRPKRSLLHMDIRPDNVLVKQGRIEAFIGWFNALIGDASLELCRVAEYGLLTPEFVEGYGSNPLDELPTAMELVYRLYTATMLAVVFLSEALDPTLGPRQADRVRKLLLQLHKITNR